MLRKYLILLLILIMILTITIGCSNEDTEEEVAASISINNDSKYISTFTELNLGDMFDFNLRLPNANRSIVTIWVEGYKDGSSMGQEPLTELSYRFSPNDVEENPMGLGIFNHNFDSKLLIYASGGKVLSDPTDIEGYVLNESGVSTGDYAIGSEAITLESGEEKLLAAYRQAEYSLRTIDYENEDSINKMIEEDDVVLLLKIIVEVVDE